ncbi:MAG: thioredoxin [Prochlorococcus sp. SP3034]|nr:thioredoxin [Prochlorococcus sp. SP3034]|tara:strand:- start:5953 stop:6498 length:546 start_codon:yes stop_codon:yes gene_type:complete
MKSENQVNSQDKNPILLLVIIFIGLISVLLIFKNTLFESTLALKSYGKISMDPVIAFNNKKPTFLEFYAEWCEVCKEMAPSIIDLKKEYQNEINFVFLNVDNPKWEKYINQYDVNGIPKVVFLNNDSEVKGSLVGLKDEKLINNSLNKLLSNNQELENSPISEFSKIEDIKKDMTTPRSHS